MVENRFTVRPKRHCNAENFGIACERRLVLLQPPQAKKKYQIHLKSHAGPIYVLLVNKDTDSTSPVVVQVPPPRDDLVSQGAVDQNQNPTSADQSKPAVKVSERTIMSSKLFFLGLAN